MDGVDLEYWHIETDRFLDSVIFRCLLQANHPPVPSIVPCDFLVGVFLFTHLTKKQPALTKERATAPPKLLPGPDLKMFPHGLKEPRAAEVPRTFGLAPPDASKEIRKQFFDSMNDAQMGGVTFRTLLAWTVEHAKGKIAAQKAGKGYKK